MHSRKLDDTYSVSEQISPKDIPAIAAAGFRSIVCNRPDGEGFGQPRFADVDAAAKAAGLETAYLPIKSGQMSERDVARFVELMRTLPGPVFGYCRSGARAMSLWQAARSMHRAS
jgi:sulfide:quinone oxidoreductase